MSDQITNRTDHVKSLYSGADTKNPAEITVKIPVKKHAQRPTAPELTAGITEFNMLFIGQRWFSLDEICWIEPYTAHYSHRTIQYPHRKITYSYLADSVSFSPNGSKLLAVVRTSLVVDGEVKGLFESGCRDPDDIERGDCKTCFIVFDLAKLNEPSESCESSDRLDPNKCYQMQELDGKRHCYNLSISNKQYRTVRWVTNEIAYYCNNPILISKNAHGNSQLAICNYIDKQCATEYIDLLKAMKLESSDMHVLAARLYHTFANYPFTGPYLAHYWFNTVQGSRHLYYVATSGICCSTVSPVINAENKIKSINITLTDIISSSHNKPIDVGKKISISQVKFADQSAYLLLDNAGHPHVCISMSPNGESLLCEQVPLD
jgi:hypothetical protein